MKTSIFTANKYCASKAQYSLSLLLDFDHPQSSSLSLGLYQQRASFSKKVKLIFKGTLSLQFLPH